MFLDFLVDDADVCVCVCALSVSRRCLAPISGLPDAGREGSSQGHAGQSPEEEGAL